MTQDSRFQVIVILEFKDNATSVRLATDQALLLMNKIILKSKGNDLTISKLKKNSYE